MYVYGSITVSETSTLTFADTFQPKFKIFPPINVFVSATKHGWSSWSHYTPCDEYCYKSRERYCYNAGNPQSCAGSPNIYGIERQNVSCSASDCPGILTLYSSLFEVCLQCICRHFLGVLSFVVIPSLNFLSVR